MINIDQCRIERVNGKSLTKLAKDFGVSVGTIRRILETVDEGNKRKLKNRSYDKKRQYTIGKLIRNKLDGAKRRAAEYNIICDLTYKSLKHLLYRQELYCAITGFKMQALPGSVYTMSLDRIIPGGPYILSNVRWICQFINLAAIDKMSELLNLFINWDTLCQEANLKLPFHDDGWYIIRCNKLPDSLPSHIIDTYNHLDRSSTSDGYIGCRNQSARELNISNSAMIHRFDHLLRHHLIEYRTGDQFKIIRHALTYRLSTAKRENTICDIDLNYLTEMFGAQLGKCKLSGMSMTTDGITGVSIDAINPNLGHIKNNIQLVCYWVNIGKSKYTNEIATEFISRLRNKHWRT